VRKYAHAKDTCISVWDGLEEVNFDKIGIGARSYAFRKLIVKYFF
jgi:hypothetical protein